MDSQEQAPQVVEKEVTQDLQQEQSDSQEQDPQVDSREAPQQTIEKSLEKALELKTEGNTLYKDRLYKEAIEKYREAIQHCPEEENRNQAILYSNTATCYYNLEDYISAIENATQAINLDKEYLKPWLCRGNCHFVLEKYEEALDDFNGAKNIDASLETNPDVQRRVTKCQKKMDEINEKRKDEVLGNLKDLGNNLLGKFGLSLDNFKMQQNQNGSYNIQFQQ